MDVSTKLTGKRWGDDGCYRVHLSTYVYLAQYMDFRSLVA